MEERCPKCGEILITKTIKKELGLGSIDYPVARVCPKCNWNMDLTGARDIKPPVIEEVEKVEVKPPAAKKLPAKVSPPRAQPTAGAAGFNKVLIIGLAILVIGGLIWAFFLYPAAPKQLTSNPAPSPTPTPTPAITATASTPLVTSTPVPEVTPTGKKILVKLDSYRGYIDSSQISLKIKQGDEVVWTNEGTYSFTLISSEDIFNPKSLDNGKRTNYTFKKTGTYGFYFKENKNLNGTIVVES